MPSRIILIGLVFLFLISCSKDKEEWEIAKTNNDLLSYKYYLDHHRNGDFADNAKYQIDSIEEARQDMMPPVFDTIPTPIKQWNNTVIDKVSVHITITATQWEEFETDTQIDIHAYIQSLLGEIGIDVLPEGEACKNRMVVNLRAAALSGNYSGLGTLFTGSLVKGYIRLSDNTNIPIQTDVFDEKPCEFNISYTEQNKQSRILKYEEPYNQLKRISIRRHINNFLYQVWGASPLVWYDWKNYTKYSEFRYDHDGTYSEDFVNNIYRACFSDNEDVREQSMLVLTRKNFPFDNDLALRIVFYNIYKFGFKTEYQNLVNQRIVAIINKLGKKALEVTPDLIEYAEIRQSKNWSEDSKEEILESVEKLIGANYGDDIEGLKKLWFENKQMLVTE